MLMLVSEGLSTTSSLICRQSYTVRMPDPTNHLFEVELQLLEADLSAPLVLKFPVWTPGSYLVREYARHLQDMWIIDGEGHPLSWQKLDKNSWQIDPISGHTLSTIYIQYRIYAHELTVRTNHLTPTHGFFNGAALFLYVPGREQEAIELRIILPDPSWRVATSLRLISEGSVAQVFLAQDFDELVDSPVEAGIHQAVDFDVLGKPHQLVIWGKGNLNLVQTVEDLQKIVATSAQIFGDLPYGSFVFLVHLTADGYGGLEHKCSTTIQFSRLEFHIPDRYQRFLSLLAHEFFHVWNVKRLRPKALETFNYNQETFFSGLWFCEGATSYYEQLILLRAGVITPQSFLRQLGESISQLQRIPGRQVQSLAEASFDTWIKLYRPHENSKNSQVSYYLKGGLVCLLLDLHIRHCSLGSQSLDSAFLELWEQFGCYEKGYSESDLKVALENAAGQSLGEFFDAYIYGTDELDYNAFLNPFGLCLKAGFTHLTPSPYLGVNFNGSGSIISSVDMGSPAQQAGLWAGDELIALDGFKVSPGSLNDRLKGYAVHHVVKITVFQDQELKTFSVALEPPRPDVYVVEPLVDLLPEQEWLCRGWLGDGLFV